MDMPVAFAVSDGKPPDRAPATAEEYLQQVRWQANSIENVVIAKDNDECDDSVPRFSLQGFPDVPPIPPGMKPSPMWEKEFIEHFKDLRTEWEENKLHSKPDSNCPPPHDRKQWRQYCFGDDSRAPTPSIVLSLDFVSVQRVLIYHIRWAQSEAMSAHRARWLFILLLRVELPLAPDLGSELYSLALRCATLRSKLTDPKDEMLPHLNILITILEKYFGQVLDVNDVDSSEEGE